MTFVLVKVQKSSQYHIKSKKKTDTEFIEILDINPKLVIDYFAKNLETINPFRLQMKQCTIEALSKSLQ